MTILVWFHAVIHVRYREDLQTRYHNVENDKDILRVKLEQLKSQLSMKEEKCSQIEVVTKTFT